MLRDTKKIDSVAFDTELKSFGRETVNFYTKQKDTILAEPNVNLDGGKIYCLYDSWIQRGDVISISGNWYIVTRLNNLANQVYKIGTIVACDVTIPLIMGGFVYEVPTSVSKYSNTTNVNGIIDTSVDGKLSFITGYNKGFENLNDNPYAMIFDKVWQVADKMNVNNVMTLYCQGTETAPDPQLAAGVISTKVHVGDKVQIVPYILNIKNTNYHIKLETAGSATRIDSKNNVTFMQTGTVNIVLRCEELGLLYISPSITVL